MSDYPEALLYMKCMECKFTSTTVADNPLVKTGEFTCPDCEHIMKPLARYEKVDEV